MTDLPDEIQALMTNTNTHIGNTGMLTRIVHPSHCRRIAPHVHQLTANGFGVYQIWVATSTELTAQNGRAPGGAQEAAPQTSLNRIPASTEKSSIGLETLVVNDISSHIADPLGEY